MHAEELGSLRVSLVSTVLNEYGSLPGWLDALRIQTRFPDECIVVDGGSNDGTLEALRSCRMPFEISIEECPGAGISAGRNIAISRATGDIVIVTDAGTQAQPDWLARLVEPLERDPNVDLVAGFFEGTGDTFWARTLVATTLPAAREVNPNRFLPSSRSLAFRRSWFDHGFRYPEWLDYCEDVVFDLQLRRAGANQCFAPAARVRFEPRRGPVAYFKQYYRYARGDGKAGLFARRHAIRYGTYMVAVTVLARQSKFEIAAGTLLGLIYIRRSVTRYRALRDGRGPASRSFVVAIVLIAAQRFIGDVAKMIGYPVGLVWRVRRDRDWRLWKTGWVRRMPSGDLPRF